MKFQNKIKRRDFFSKLKHEIAWEFILIKTAIKHVIHTVGYNSYIPYDIKKDIQNTLMDGKEYVLSMQKHDEFKDLKQYLDMKYVGNEYLNGMMDSLEMYLESKFGKYKDIDIRVNHDQTKHNVIIRVKLK